MIRDPLAKTRDPVLRLQLDVESLADVTVRPGGGPFTETVLSLRLWHRRQPGSVASAWLDQVRPRFEPPGLPHPALTLVEILSDLHLAATQAPTIEQALQLLAERSATPAPVDADAMTAWADRAGHRATGWVRHLLDGDGAVVDRLAKLFLDYYQRAIDPVWRSIHSHLEAERARCGQVMARRGSGRLLATLHPQVRWQAPWLEVRRPLDPARPGRRGLDLGPVPAVAPRPSPVPQGTSVVLVPSAFCLDGPELLWGPHHSGRPVALVYPTLRWEDAAGAVLAPGPRRDPSALARLLGQTQAAALAAIADTCTTTELAHRLGVALATASHHTGILRAAGLVLSQRHGNTVVHRLTALGADLLRGKAG